MRTTNQTRPRGVAMLLVLISLAMATIITTAYLASRDNSAAIGENVSASAAARWTAGSGLELAAAILQTEADWRNLHIDGKLLDDYSMSGGMLDIDLVDVESGLAPTDATKYVEVISTATVNGVVQTATATATITDTGGGEVDLDLSEFAIFAQSYLGLEGHSTLTRWPTAPLSALSRRVAIGTQSVGAGAVKIKTNAAAIDTTIYDTSDASAGLVSNDSGSVVIETALPDPVPMPAPPTPDATLPADDPTFYPGLSLFMTNAMMFNDVRKDFVDLEYSRIWIQGDHTLVSEWDVFLDTNSKLVIDGDVTIVAFDDLRMNSAAIELLPDATLTIYVYDDVIVNDSYIGEDRPDGERDVSGNAGYMNPERVRIYGMGDNNSHWYIEGDSVIKAAVYAPDVEIEVRDFSAMYGSLAAWKVHAHDDASIFYDHALDPQRGFTTLTSSIYNGEGRVKNAILSLLSFNDSDLVTLAGAENLEISIGDRVIGDAGEEVPVVVLPGDPTPRPVPVDYEITSFGSDVNAWEVAAAGGG